MTKKKANPIVSELFCDIKLNFKLFQKHCESVPTDSTTPDAKPMFLKDLRRVFQMFPQWNFSNTVMILNIF